MDDQLKNGIAVFASGYAKRMLDQQYDKLGETAAGQKLKSLPKGAKYGIEAGLYALMAFADQKFVANTPLTKFFKEIIKDAPPEIAKRMFDKVRADLTIDVQEIKDPADKAAVECLLALDDASLASTLAWLGSVEKAEAQALAGRLADLSPEQLKRFATLSPEQKSILLGHRPTAPEPKPEPKPSLLNSFNERLKAARSGVQKNIEDVRNS